MGTSMSLNANQQMSQQALTQNPESASHLKDVFEQSLAMLGEKNSGVERNKPIRQRRSAVPIHIDAACLQKRALEDAAKALASLWNVTTPGQTRVQNRPLQYARKLA